MKLASETVVLIPAFNEENAVAKVILDIPKNWVDEIIVVNNNSTDQTSIAAKNAGATVIDEPIKGYGRACLKGIDYIEKTRGDRTKIVVFIDADYSDYPSQMPDLIQPILNKEALLVIGSRALGNLEKGSMTIPQRFGNALATKLIQWIYGKTFTDLGPYRAIEYDALKKLKMQDKDFGWTVEMQVKAIKQNFNFVEVPVNYRKRIGFSKISGTVKGTLMAGYKIITTIFKYL